MYRRTHGDDTLDNEELLPGVDLAEAIKLEDARGQETTECTSQRSHDDVECEAEAELSLAVPTREVVGDAGKHTGLKHAEEETDGSGVGKVGRKSGEHGEEAKPKGQEGKPLSRTNDLAQKIAGDLG